MLARIVGRKSGRVYRQPLSCVRDGDGRLDPDRLGTAIRFGFTIVRWHLAPAPPE